MLRSYKNQKKSFIFLPCSMTQRQEQGRKTHAKEKDNAHSIACKRGCAYSKDVDGGRVYAGFTVTESYFGGAVASAVFTGPLIVPEVLANVPVA